jgi:DNA-binding MarR family transcriptional regulator
MTLSMSRTRPQALPRTASAAPRDVRVALDALRHIVQALRGGGMVRGPVRLGSAQLFALRQIAEHPGASVNDVAALTCTHQSSVSVVIQALVQRGLVARVPSPADRRRRRLAVTVQGLRQLRQAPAAAQEALIAAITGLPVAERRRLAAALGTIARTIAPAGVRRHPPMFFEGRDATRPSGPRR